MSEVYSDGPARRLFNFRLGRFVVFGRHADGEGWGYEPVPKRVRFGIFRMPEGVAVILGEFMIGVGRI